MTYSPKGHLPALDGLRGIAILWVILLHYTKHQSGGVVAVAFTSVVKSGWAGVDLFFVLSGFLITRILLASKGAPGYFRNFYARRALRIFPVYYAYLLGVTVILPLVFPANTDVTAYAVDAPWHWLYLSNILPIFKGMGQTAHLWSLAVEEQFYLIWPLLVFLLSTRGLVNACVILVVGAVTLRLGIALTVDNPAMYLFMLPARMGALAIGSLLALGAVAHFERIRRAAPATLAVTGTLLVLLSLPTNRLATVTVPQMSAGLTVLAIFFAALIVVAVSSAETSLLSRTLNARALTAIGKYSYCMYVVHLIAGDFVLRKVRQLPLSGVPMEVVVVSVGTSVTFGIAWASWHLWEKHWLKLKARFEYREGAAMRRPAATAVSTPTSTGGVA